MGYTVADKSIMEVTFRGRHHDQRILSLFHYQLDSGGVEQDGVALLNLANTALNGAATTKLLGAYLAAVATDFVVQEVVFQWIWPVRRARVVRVPASNTGLVEGVSMPPNLAAAITKRSETAGRHGHGTLHMPALVRSSVEGGELNLLGSDFYGFLLSRLSEPIDAEFAGVLNPVILNRNTPLASVKITTAESQVTVRTMHRRTVGVGE